MIAGGRTQSAYGCMKDGSRGTGGVEDLQMTSDVDDRVRGAEGLTQIRARLGVHSELPAAKNQARSAPQSSVLNESFPRDKPKRCLQEGSRTLGLLIYDHVLANDLQLQSDALPTELPRARR